MCPRKIGDMSSEEVMDFGKDRKRLQTRSMLCYWATDRLGLSQTELAQIVHLSQPAISQAVGRRRELAKAQSHSFLNE